LYQKQTQEDIHRFGQLTEDGAKGPSTSCVDMQPSIVCYLVSWDFWNR